MMTLLFAGVATVLLLTALYWWARGRGRPRATGTRAICALLFAFSIAFASYAPAVEEGLESVVPHIARLISNSSTVTAATSVLVFMYQLNLTPQAAQRRSRALLLALCLALAGMTAFFIAEQASGRSPQLYALYLLIYISFLAFTATDFLRQTWEQARRSRRASQRVGLRITAVGCGFALVYAGYKVLVLVSLGLGLNLLPDHQACTTLVTPIRCAFSVTTPAVSVLLIAFGLTLPALTWPVSRLLRARWERQSYRTLRPLWEELTAAMPEVILPASDDDTEDIDFLLHRRVIEINDGVLALRPFRSLHVQEEAQRSLADSERESEAGAAVVEAAVLSAALQVNLRVEQEEHDPAPPAPGTETREGNLRAETRWLLHVARARSSSDPPRVVHVRPPATERIPGA